MRSALASAIVAFGYGAVTFSLAQVQVKTDPASAHRLAPYDGRVTARLAVALTGSDRSASDRQRAEKLAKISLQQDPTAVGAVSVLGIGAQLRGDLTSARRLFRYAEKLSRRDAITQLWAIEDAVARGDVKGALRHYDITLRTKPAMAGTLYPVLTAASSEPLIRRELIRTLAAKPPWSDSFISFVVANGKDPQAIASLFASLREVDVSIPQAARSSVIGTLLVNGATNQAWAYYILSTPGVHRSGSRDPRFTAQLEVPTPLDWVAISDGGVSSNIGHGVFDFSVPASVGGPLLQQTQLLPAGEYRLDGHGEGIDQAENARPFWVLTCSDGRELGRVNMPNSNQAGGNFGGTLRVPADCPMQALTLVARPSESVGGLSARIDRIELTPVR